MTNPATYSVLRILSLIPAIAAALVPAAIGLAAEPAATRPAAGGEPAALERIRRLRAPLEPGEDFDAFLRKQIRRRAELLEEVDSFLARFPESEQRDRLIALKLETMFLLAVQRGQRFEALVEYADRLLRTEPTPRLSAHAEYWKMRAELAARQREGMSVDQVYQLRDRRIADFVDRFPTSPLTPPLAYELVQHAWERNQTDVADKYVEILTKNFPDHLQTRSLRAQLLRIRVLGSVVEFRTTTTSGAVVDAAQRHGRFLLLHYWAGFNAPSVRLLDDLRKLARRHPDRLEIVGVNLDTERSTLEALLAEHDVTWPQIHEGRGWASEAARRWDIQSLPATVLIDPDGRLVVLNLTVNPIPAIRSCLSPPASSGKPR